MDDNAINYNKKNGVFYTPSQLAEYLADPLIGSDQMSVLDPSYGEGSLLLAAERIARQKNHPDSIHLYGCDIKPVNGLLRHLPEANLIKRNFFEFAESEKFDLVLMNPPYVRHHLQDLDVMEGYKRVFPLLARLTYSSDLWAYFVLKASLHLRPGGNIGAILPWSFLQADYAQPLRKWLFDNFNAIKVLALSGKYFEQADERVVLVWLRGFGSSCGTIEMAYSKYIDENISFSSLSMPNWLGKKVIFEGGLNANMILSSFENVYGFKPIKTFAEVKIGVVTGADSYFILSQEEANKECFGKRNQVPIIASSKQFLDVHLNGNRNLRSLLVIPRKDREKYWSYICRGVKKKYNLRAHSLRRDPWYTIKVGKTPDAFFPYRSKNPPYLLLNEAGAQCTNSVHRVYFKGLNSTEIKWFQLSLLSEAGQLSLEAQSKTYGKGIIKIEPSALMNTLVLVSSDVAIEEVYIKVSDALKSGDRLHAISLATNFINAQLAIPEYLVNSVHLKLTELRDQRTSR